MNLATRFYLVQELRMSSTKFCSKDAFMVWTPTNLYCTAFGLHDFELFIVRYKKMVIVATLSCSKPRNLACLLLGADHLPEE
jgi:hypothetical protein